jgi:hypothetical protein
LGLGGLAILCFRRFELDSNRFHDSEGNRRRWQSIFYWFPSSSTNILFCYWCNCITSVTRGDFRPPGSSPAVRGTCRRYFYNEGGIGGGGQIQPRYFNSEGDGDGDPRGGREGLVIFITIAYPGAWLFL